jgi:hypothetical protein
VEDERINPEQYAQPSLGQVTLLLGLAALRRSSRLGDGSGVEPFCRLTPIVRPIVASVCDKPWSLGCSTTCDLLLTADLDSLGLDDVALLVDCVDVEVKSAGEGLKYSGSHFELRCQPALAVHVECLVE